MEMPYRYKVLSEHADKIVTKTFAAVSLVLWFPYNKYREIHYNIGQHKIGG